jgi:hypothetical protein
MADKQTPPPQRNRMIALDGAINSGPPPNARPQPPKAQMAAPKAQAAPTTPAAPTPTVPPPRKSRG